MFNEANAIHFETTSIMIGKINKEINLHLEDFSEGKQY
jgi:hypothetical protein